MDSRGRSAVQKFRLLAAGAILIMIASFATFVWPTRYRFAAMKGVPVRIDRVSGRPERLTADGWESLGPADDQVSSLPAGARSAITQRGATIKDGMLVAVVFNDSEWRLRSLKIWVSVKDARGVQKVDRRFDLPLLDANSTGQPGTVCTFYRGVDIVIYPMDQLDWSIVAAAGIRRPAR